ncbi:MULTISPECIES: alpha/beta hydrolase [Kitasatospora]|uniref:alpha/beta hydrolase n=1 Tax=Kitasatospora TaxID=2063 RepID=UPI000C70282D|nr:alpha/beta hydrolase [Kitasatospora sp. GP30]MDH6141947.1 pimeloyl-ACP methyl ester carboxylesterase [Kitasatospora sp. GP30]
MKITHLNGSRPTGTNPQSQRLQGTHRVALLLAATSTVLALTAPLAHAAPRGPELHWGPCTGAGTGVDPRQQCATLAVPLDYRQPDGPSITLAVSRIPATQPRLRRGVLVTIPGGPGGSGLNRPSDAAKRLPQSVLDRYDLIGFDPRGVGQSTPVSCGLSHEDLSPVNMYPWPAPDGGITANVAFAQHLADKCWSNGGPVLRTLSTANEARDLDSIRSALGARRMSAWGVSYGTYVGAVYATMFPQHTDRVVLDSNDDPDATRVGRGWLDAFASGAEDRFPDFAAWAGQAGNPDRVADTPEQVRADYLDLAARLDRSPIPWPGANPAELNGNVLRSVMLQSLYSDADFPQLAELMLAAQGRRPLPAPTVAPDAALQNTFAVSVGTLCGDVSWPASVADYAQAAAVDRVVHPLTAGMPVNVMPCAFWPAKPTEPPVVVGDHGPSNVLLIQNLRDPATPYSGALRLRSDLGDRARLVTVDSGGHDAYLANGNACGDDLVTEYLVTGRRPEQDAYCPAQ